MRLLNASLCCHWRRACLPLPVLLRDVTGLKPCRGDSPSVGIYMENPYGLYVLNITHVYIKLLLQKRLPIKLAEKGVCLFFELHNIVTIQHICHSLKSVFEFVFCFPVSVFL